MTMFIAYGHKYSMRYMPMSSVGFYRSGSGLRIIDVNGHDDSDAPDMPPDYEDFRLLTPEQLIAELNTRTPANVRAKD